jgi:dTDP-4-amino-4,6-dideoxygalactose transaminase
VTVATLGAVRTARTRAVIAVHQGGLPFDVAALRAACARWDVALVEDAACAAGSTVRGRPVGAGAAIAAWSFHPRKVLTTGEGGALTLDSPQRAARLRRLREHGMNVSAADRHASATPVLESYLETGFNYRMTDVQAAIGLVQLSKMDEMVARRRELAARYQDLLAAVPGLVPVRDPEYGRSNYQTFWVLVESGYGRERNDLLAKLAEAGVSARRGIMAAHLEPAYSGAAVPARPARPGRPVRPVLPVTERLTRDSLILPLYHQLSHDDQDHVVETLAKLAR